jgi:hypothetical protein
VRGRCGGLHALGRCSAKGVRADVQKQNFLRSAAGEDRRGWPGQRGHGLCRDEVWHQGLAPRWAPTPVIEVDNEEIKAFHLCHHRSSIIYEVLSRDGGALSIYEYSIPVRTKVKVKEFQDAVPASSLVCADQWLLRASPSALRAVHLPSGVQSELHKFQEHDASDGFASLSVAYAADVIGKVEVFAASPANRTIVRLRLQDDGSGLLREEANELVLAGGDGSDGPLASATVQSPSQLTWTRGKVIFTDGCTLRELDLTTIGSARVRTLLGSGAACVRPGNETLEPSPWASRLSRPIALASGAEGTASSSALLLTEAQVLHIADEPNVCSGAPRHGHESAEAACVSASAKEHAGGCGWAEGPAVEEQLCMECNAFEGWAASQRPAVDLCSLEGTSRAGTRYGLSGCGCAVKPTMAPDEEQAERVQFNLSILLVLAALVTCVLLYRRGRRVTRMREMYGVDTAEFHVFRDDEAPAG